MAQHPAPVVARSADAVALARFVAAGHPLVAIASNDELAVRDFLVEALVADSRRLLNWTVARGLAEGRFTGGAGHTDTEHPAAALYRLAHGHDHPMVAVFIDLAPHLDDARTLRLLREASHRCAIEGSMIILVDHQPHLPPVIESDAVRIEPTLPDSTEIEEILRRTVRRLHRSKPVAVELRRSQLAAIVNNLRGLTRSQIERVVAEAVVDDRRLDSDDLAHVLALKRRVLSAELGGSAIEFIETPADLDEIGGLRRLKRWLAQRQRGFSAEAATHGLQPPRGVLLLGVQGAGKSLCAKAVAAAWHLPLMRLDPGALYDRYVGESEKRLRMTLRAAEHMAPIVLWIDEIEKGFASAASRSSDGGLSQRMFGTLLTWMQEHRSPVFLFATANDIEALPPELLRKGRFDEIFFVDLPDEATRREIVAIHLRRRKLDPARFDLDAVAAATEGYSGAELEQGIVSALHESLGAAVPPATEDLVRALRASPPLSVTMAERIEMLRAWARGRCVPADEPA